MASHVDLDLSYQLVDRSSQVKNAIKAIQREEIISVDCEGVNLSRDGSLTVVTVGTNTATCLFDVLELGAGVFDRGLRQILEDSGVVKLMFDCRGDSEALWHLYKVWLTNVLDVQLMQVLYERSHPDEKPKSQKDLEKRLKDNEKKGSAAAKAKRKVLNSWTWIHGLVQCIKWYLEDTSLFEAKMAADLKGEDADHEMWGKRPLTEKMKLYATIDVATLFQLHEKFKQGISGDELDAAFTGSDRYLGFFRDMEDRPPPNPYECHGMLQMFILDDPPLDQIKQTCDVCSLDLPRSVFTADGLCQLCDLKKFKVEEAKKCKEQYEKREARREREREFEREREQEEEEEARQLAYADDYDDENDYDRYRFDHPMYNDDSEDDY